MEHRYGANGERYRGQAVIKTKPLELPKETPKASLKIDWDFDPKEKKNVDHSK